MMLSVYLLKYETCAYIDTFICLIWLVVKIVFLYGSVDTLYKTFLTSDSESEKQIPLKFNALYFLLFYGLKNYP